MKLVHADCLDWLKKQPDNSIHLFLSDPPYGLVICGLQWDQLPTKEILKEIYRVLIPVGFFVAFSSPRTYHNLAYQAEQTGFDIHPFISWIYSSGMPHAHDVGKITDDVKWIGQKVGKNTLKPSNEPIGIFQKKFNIKNQRESVLLNGVGSYNIKETKIGDRHSANVITDMVGEDFQYFYYCSKVSLVERNLGCDSLPEKQVKEDGGARLYSDKCGNCGKKFVGEPQYICSCENPITERLPLQKNHHCAVKPISIMIYLFKMFVCPVPDFKVVDPFLGSGTTGMASVLFPNVDFTGIEKEKEYFEISEARCKFAEDHKEEMIRCLDEDKNKLDYNEMNISERKGGISDLF